MRVVLTVDVPAQDEPIDADAVVVALKSRTVPAADAVEQSLRACRWLRKQGAGQIYFKICSTFDSTAAGNIGPVIEALMDELDCDFSIATPAFPETGRTVVHGHLFLGDTLLSDSGMRHHPLTPMTDANLVRVLQAQLNPAKGRKVGLIDYRTVAQSAEAIRQRMDELQAEGIAIAIVDALNDEDLDRLGEALRDAPFLTAGSGLGDSLPRNWGFSPRTGSTCRRRADERPSSPAAARWPPMRRCSASFATEARPTRCSRRSWRRISSCKSPACWPGPMPAGAAKRRCRCSSTRPRSRTEVQRARNCARCIVEQAMAALARAFVQRGVGSLVVAGGETAGICVQALDIRQMQIGPQIDPGVPWCYATSAEGGLHIALKSGNFGSPDFFNKAFAFVA